MKKILYLTFFALVITINGYSQCNVIYVTPYASPTGAGTIANPKNIEAAFASATDGTIIRLTAGEYYINKTLEIPANNVIIDGGYYSNFSRKVESSLYYSTGTIIHRSAGYWYETAPNLKLSFIIKSFIAISAEYVSGFEIRDINIQTDDIYYDNLISPQFGSLNNGVTNYGIYLNSCSDYKIVNTSIKVG